jgi:hypothetical protein
MNKTPWVPWDEVRRRRRATWLALFVLALAFWAGLLWANWRIVALFVEAAMTMR